MAAHAHSGNIPAPGRFIASTRIKTIYSAMIFLGVIAFALTLVREPDRAWHSYLTAFFYVLNFSLGALFFVATQHAANAGWSVNIRRFAEAMTSFIPIAAVGAIVYLFGAKTLYIWMDPEVLATDRIIAGKSGYLNVPFFLIRVALFFGAWVVFRYFMIGNSLKQDKDGDEKHTLKNVRLSIAFFAVYALSFSFWSVDSLMSLQPHWFSTIWGVYHFAGGFQSCFAVLIIITIIMMKKGLVNGLVSEHHLHDLGKFMKAFTIFWAYVAFSQFMLIWYANLPEETAFYLNRSTGGWMAASFSLLFFKWLVPFLLLLPKAAKRTPAHLILVACIILVMNYVDLHWIVYPNLVNGSELYHGKWIFGWQELGPILLFGGLFIWSVTNFLQKNPIIPVRDPRIEESVHHHVTY